MKTNVSLRPYNSFGFDAIAKQFTEINAISDLQALIQSGALQRQKTLILSGGNNILFQNEVFDGIVVYINTKGIEILREDGNDVVVRAQAGEDWPDFVRFCVGKGWHGVENLAHIPGKVGAAPVQNIGAYGMELKDSFLQCEAINLYTGESKVFTKEECRFGYRDSAFKHELKGKYIVTSVVYKVKKGDAASALWEEGSLWVTLVGIILFALNKTVAPAVPGIIGKVILIIGCVMILYGGTRGAKGFGKFTSIFGTLYNTLTGWFGDILSYSRIMALMLAGSVIATVFNTIGGIANNLIFFLVIFLIGHALNFALNLLGCYVHDLRLQCLEYFGKFYKDGGRPFAPLAANPKYYDTAEY